MQLNYLTIGESSILLGVFLEEQNIMTAYLFTKVVQLVVTKRNIHRSDYNVIMYSNSTILGNCNVGDNVILATGTIIKDQDIPNNSIVFGESPNLVIKEKSEGEMYKLIDEI